MQWKQDHYFYKKNVYNVIMMQGKVLCSKRRGDNVNEGKFYQSGCDVPRIRNCSTDIIFLAKN
jgi:hypothetical protein